MEHTLEASSFTPMQLQSVHPGIVSVWRLNHLLLGGPIVLALLVATLWTGWFVAAPVVAILGGLFAWWSWWWSMQRFERLRFGVDETGIRIERGVWWRSIVALPRARIQHSDVTQGPLQRRYGVATLSFFTAGSVHTHVGLPGLAHADAVALRDALVGMIEGGSGV
jgi:membrane protein YdbS with pleckstrin-like domain